MGLNFNTLLVLSIFLISLQHKYSYCSCPQEFTIIEPVIANTIIYDFTNCSSNISENCGTSNSSLELGCQDTEDPSLYPLEISDRLMLKAAGELDREEKETYNLRCFYSLGSDSSSTFCNIFDFVLHIEDINDNGPVFSQDSYSISLSETKISHLYDFQITDSAIIGDKDSVINSEYVLTLLTSDSMSDVFEVLKKPNHYGFINIRNIKPLDREVMSIYTLTLFASDAQDSSMNSTAQLIINILDTNDNPPIISNASGPIYIHVNKQIGDEVGKVVATDRDIYPNNQIKYYLSESCSYTSSSVYTLLQIDPDTGVMTLSKSIDPDADNLQMIQVVAVDPTDTTKFDCVEFEIVIPDVSDNDPQLEIQRLVQSVEEEQTGDIEIALLLISDEDNGENGRVYLDFSCNSYPNCSAYFEIKELTTNVYKFFLIKPLDYEMGSQVNITFNFHDSGEIPRNSSSEFILPIDPINEFDPIFQSPTYNCVIREDLLIGESFCTEVRATDSDSGIDGKIKYSIIAETAFPTIVVVREYFTISDSGSLVLEKEFDFEKLSENDTKYFFQLKASNIDLTKFSITNISFVVIDVNDNAPYFNGLSSKYLISEDAGIGTKVVSFRTIDIDSGPNGQMEVSILPSDTTEFEVQYSEESWSLLTSSELDRESSPSYSLVLVVVDLGEPSLSSEHNFVINLQDVNDNRPYFEKKEYTFTLAMGNDTWGIPVVDDDLEIIVEIRFDFSDSPELESAIKLDTFRRHIVLSNPSALTVGDYGFTIHVRDESISTQENSARFILSYKPSDTEPPPTTDQIAAIAGAGISILLFLILIVIVAIICLTFCVIKRRVVNIRYQPQVQRRKKHHSIHNPSSILKINGRFQEYNNPKKVSFNSSVQLMTFNLPKVSSSESTSYTTSEISNEEQANQWTTASKNEQEHFYSNINDPESWIPSTRQVYQPPGHRHTSTSTSSEVSQNHESKDSNAPLIGHSESFYPNKQEVLIANPHAVYHNYNPNMMGYNNCKFNQLSPEDYFSNGAAMYDIGEIMPDIQDSDSTDDSEKPPYGAVPIYISSDMTSEGELSAAMYSDNCTNISNQAEYCVTNIHSDSYNEELTS